MNQETYEEFTFKMRALIKEYYPDYVESEVSITTPSKIYTEKNKVERRK